MQYFFFSFIFNTYVKRTEESDRYTVSQFKTTLELFQYLKLGSNHIQTITKESGAGMTIKQKPRLYTISLTIKGKGTEIVKTWKYEEHRNVQNVTPCQKTVKVNLAAYWRDSN